MLNVATELIVGSRPAGDLLPTQKVVIVNGSPRTLELLETILEAGHYDFVFVESNRHAYSQIKHVRPDLVILCISIDDLEGFQVLSMLKLDEATRGIPVVTYTVDESDEVSSETPGLTEPEMFPLRTAPLKN
jgi:PleD family two-component response regulator